MILRHTKLSTLPKGVLNAINTLLAEHGYDDPDMPLEDIKYEWKQKVLGHQCGDYRLHPAELAAARQLVIAISQNQVEIIPAPVEYVREYTPTFNCI
jgi:hypothetical protein